MRACSFLLHYFMYFMWTVKLFESPAAVFKLKPVVCGCRPAGHSRPAGRDQSERKTARERERERNYLYLHIYFVLYIYIYTCASHLRDVYIWHLRDARYDVSPAGRTCFTSARCAPLHACAAARCWWASARCPGRGRHLRDGRLCPPMWQRGVCGHLRDAQDEGVHA